jgi:hypothetical protein
MAGTGRTPVQTDAQRQVERNSRQSADDRKRETRRSLMEVVAKATDVLVKRAPVSKKGDLPHTRWEYHERITTGRRREE